MLYHFILWQSLPWIEVLVKARVVIEWECLHLALSRSLSVRPGFFVQLENRFVKDSGNGENERVVDLLVDHAPVDVLTSQDRDGKWFADACANEHSRTLLTLLSRKDAVEVISANTLLIYCSRFAKHLSVDGDVALTVMECLLRTHKEAYGSDSLTAIHALHVALNSFNLSHFWTFSVTPKVIRFFVQRGVDLNEQDERGKTVLHWAYATGKTKIIELCLELGASEDVCDNEGRLPRDDQRVVRKWQSVKSSGSFK